MSEEPQAAIGAATSEKAEPLLALDGVQVRFPAEPDWLGRPRAFVHAVNGVDLTIRRGETLGVVGESGCGKSTLGLAVMGLQSLWGGRIVFAGHDLGALGKAELRGIRRRFQVVFQDPQSSLNPRMRAWRIISEPLTVNASLASSELRSRAEVLAAQVGLRREQLDRFPHEFSGGQRQRIAVARALALEPDLIVLDEPTSALDVSVQAQILNLLFDLQRQLGLTYLFISHDVSVIRHFCDRIAVMYLGQIVEIGPCQQVLDDARHPYTRTLLFSVPSLDHEMKLAEGLERTELPSNRVLPQGCFFLDRCRFAGAGCDGPQSLARLDGDAGHLARCHRWAELPAWKP
jgi:peptide/nickel transport system ATP-binding protein